MNIDGVLQTLMERGLVKIAGRAEIPGRPLLYETTQFFLDHFGLRNLDELPNVEEVAHRHLPKAPGSTSESSRLNFSGNGKLWVACARYFLESTGCPACPFGSLPKSSSNASWSRVVAMLVGVVGSAATTTGWQPVLSRRKTSPQRDPGAGAPIVYRAFDLHPTIDFCTSRHQSR